MHVWTLLQHTMIVFYVLRRTTVQIYSLDLGFQRKWFLTTENSFSAESLKPFLNDVE